MATEISVVVIKYCLNIEVLVSIHNMKWFYQNNTINNLNEC